MRGILLSLHAGRGAQLTPLAVPVVLLLIEPGTAPSYGRVAAGHTCFARYKAALKRTLDDQFAVFAGI